MSQSAKSSTTTNRSTKSSESLRPHYYTTFQSSCCGEKVNSTTTTQIKNVLPIPDKFKIEAEKLLNAINELLIENLARVAEHTSVIPNKFFEKNDNYQTQRYFIDRVMIKTLEEADIINRIPQFTFLYPIRTSGNGNCLLHAVLIAMIGIHDCNLYLRDRLAQFMTDNKDLLKTHWRIERLKSDKTYGITTEDSNLDDEWKEVCDLVHYENFEDGQVATNLKFLEAVHIFSISNMLHRPIIVLSEDVIRNKNGEAISVNDLFGIYLPILSSPNECINEPIVLAYDRSHFCPLQTIDSDEDKKSDNLLLLYPSIHHTLEKSLLPIRFLGDDVTDERSKNLLHDYLRIREIDYNYDPKSPAIRVLCAELGTKHLLLEENFFLLYYKYVKDFFEIQKPKAIEEERQRERERALEEYVSHHTSYDTHSRPLIKYDTSPTRSPRSMDTGYNIQPSSQTKYYQGQQYSYDDMNTRGTYHPRNDGIYLENSSIQPQQSQRSPDHAKAIQREPRVDYTSSSVYREIFPRTNTDNINNLNNNGKIINTTTLQVEENKSRFGPERQRAQVIQIPVEIISQNSLSNNETLTSRTQRRATSDICVLCDQIFENYNSDHICAACDRRIRNDASHNDTFHRPSSTRSRSTNLYLPTYDSAYKSVLSPTPKTRSLQKVTCPHCRNPNLLYNLNSNSEYRCSACQNPIPTSYRYRTTS